MTKFEINKDYCNVSKVGVYTYYDVLHVEEIKDKFLMGTWEHYVVNEHGFKFGEFSHAVATHIRKAPAKDYEKTTDLAMVFYSNN